MSRQVGVLERFMQLHVRLHPEGNAMQELLNAGVAPHRVLALYPFELREWLDELFETVAPSGWDTIRTTTSAGKVSNGWLDSVQQLNRTLTATLYGDWEAFAVTDQGDRLRDVVEATIYDYEHKELVSRNVSMLLFETVTVASRWGQLPQMHEWKDTEAILLAVLDAIASAHAEGVIVLAELEAAREESARTQ